MSKTKIICTVGPACGTAEVLEEMIHSGMNVARFNFSYGTHVDHQAKIDTLKSVRKKLKVPIAIMLDTKGPEYRIGYFEKGSVHLVAGDRFTFTTQEIQGDRTRVSVSYSHLAEELEPGDKILINPGNLTFTVTDIQAQNVICHTDTSGVLSDRKNMSFPQKVLKQGYLSDKDKSDLLFGIQNEVDYISCSFVSCKQDLLDVKTFLAQNGGKTIRLIAKIENSNGFEHLKEICSECDGIMIGRGDMGIEMPLETLPGIQKKMILECRSLGKEVITATEMLESMIHYSRPSRAEVTDVANAVYDGTDAMMLSGETATGRFPVLAVKTMESIARATEENEYYKRRIQQIKLPTRNDMETIAQAVVEITRNMDIKAIVVYAPTETAAQALSRFRPPVDILALCVSKKIQVALSLDWGVTQILCERYPSCEELLRSARQTAIEKLGLKHGDKIIIMDGAGFAETGKNQAIYVETIMQQ